MATGMAAPALGLSQVRRNQPPLLRPARAARGAVVNDLERADNLVGRCDSCDAWLYGKHPCPTADLHYRRPAARKPGQGRLTVASCGGNSVRNKLVLIGVGVA